VTKDGLPNGRTYTYEHFNEVDDCWYQYHEKAMTWPTGCTAKYTIAVDISELKVMQNRLAEAHAQLALKNRELTRRNELLQENIKLREDVEHITRHDLKTPLGAMITLPRLLIEEEGVPESIVEGLQVIESSGLQMLNLINRSLDLYRLEAGTYRFKPLEMDMALLLRRVATDLKPLLSGQQTTFEMTIDGASLTEDAQLLMEGEELLLYTMLANLMTNAVEASPMGERVFVDIASSSTETAISIKNLGEVPESIRHHFFKKYATAGKVGGTGLGAYSARLMAQLHNGSIELDASVSGVTKITVRLPRNIGDATPA
jgi:signal transduction histidine kinase